MKATYALIFLIFSLITIGASALANATPVKWQKGEDNYYAFDGVFYSFINTSGQGVKLWTPPSIDPIRGVIVFGNPGGGFGGDTRSKTHQRDILEFAGRHNFAVAGVTGFPAIQTIPLLAKVFVDTFTQWSTQGTHPELEHVPFIFTGGSNAGIFAFSMMTYVPDRTIAITPNCGPVYHGKITEKVLAVPAWMHVGTRDPYLPRGVELTSELFVNHAPFGGVWAWDAEIKGHENGSADHVDFAYWDAIIPLRLSSQNNSDFSVKLNTLNPKAGWWVDHRSWDYAIPRVGSARENKSSASEKGRYGWVPNEGVARIYQAASSRARTILLEFVLEQETSGGDRSGIYLSSSGNVVASPGQRIRLKVELGDLAGFVKVLDIYDRAEKIGTLNLEESTVFEFSVEKRKRVYALYARGYSKGLNFQQGLSHQLAPRISNPLQIVVRDPELSKKIDRQLDGVSFLKSHASTRMNTQHLIRLESDVTSNKNLSKSMLGAVNVASKNEKETIKNQNVSPLWEKVRFKYPGINIDQSHLFNTNKVDSLDLPQRVRVNAAYSAKGLHLLFQVDDPNCGVDNVPVYCGTIDLHLASIGLPYLHSLPPSPENYSYGVIYSLLNNALQFKIPVPNGHAEDQKLDIHYWDLWSYNNFSSSSAVNFDNLGVRIDVDSKDDHKRLVDVFLPWHLMGNPGLAHMPVPGTSLSTVISYKSKETNTKLSWPYGIHPWVTPAFVPSSTGFPLKVYGQIVFLDEVL